MRIALVTIGSRRDADERRYDRWTRVICANPSHPRLSASR